MNPFIQIHSCEKLPKKTVIHKSDTLGWLISAYSRQEASEDIRLELKASNITICPYCGQSLNKEQPAKGIQNIADLSPELFTVKKQFERLEERCNMARLIIEGAPEEIADTVFMLGITPDNIEIETGIEIEEDGCHCGYSGCECDYDSQIHTLTFDGLTRHQKESIEMLVAGLI